MGSLGRDSLLRRVLGQTLASRQEGATRSAIGHRDECHRSGSKQAGNLTRAVALEVRLVATTHIPSAQAVGRIVIRTLVRSRLREPGGEGVRHRGDARTQGKRDKAARIRLFNGVLHLLSGGMSGFDEREICRYD
jgi:hypothetical protein